MKKLISILGGVGLTATGASSVVACKEPAEGTKKQPYKKNLSELIKTTYLGEITMSGGNPTVAELEAAIRAQNPRYQNGVMLNLQQLQQQVQQVNILEQLN